MFNQQFYQQPFGGYQYQQPMLQQGAYQEVEGPESIQMLRLPPNCKAVFFDKHRDRFYAVSTDAAGTKAVDAYDFAKAQEPRQPEYLTVDAFNAWRSQYEQPIQQQPTTAATEPVAASAPTWKPAGGAAPNPANAAVGANHARPVQQGPQVG